MAKKDEDRGPIALWMRRERLARGWTTEDVVNQLAKRGVNITEPSYRGYEAGPGVSKPVRTALEAVFESKPPEPDTEKERAGDLPALVSAIRDQTAAISALVEELQAARGAKPRTVGVSLEEDPLIARPAADVAREVTNE